MEWSRKLTVMAVLKEQISGFLRTKETMKISQRQKFYFKSQNYRKM